MPTLKARLSFNWPGFWKQLVRTRHGLSRFLYKRLVRPPLFTSRLGRRIIFSRVGTAQFDDHVYQSQSSGYSWPGKLVDWVLLRLPASKATRFRIKNLGNIVEAEIHRNLKEGRTSRIIDLGSGTARYLLDLAGRPGLDEKSFQAICFDVNRGALRLGKRLSRGLPIQYRIGDVSRLGKYHGLARRISWRPNIAIISICFEYLSAGLTRRLLEDVYHTLEPGGVAVIMGQVRDPRRSLTIRTRFPGSNGNHAIHCRQPDEMKKWMIETGFKEIRTEIDGWGLYCSYVGRRIGKPFSTGGVEVPIFQKGHAYRRVKDMRLNDAYQYTRGFVPSGLRKSQRTPEGPILMATNDYLGLRTHPRVLSAAVAATKRYGVSAASSSILTGNLEIHEELQSKLAQFLGVEDALVMASGYAANVGIVSAILVKDEVAFVDRFAHASLLDGCRLSGGVAMFFPHNNVEALERLLEKHNDVKERVIICDGVYSMDGDLAPLPDLFRISQQHKAGLVIDDAHAIGVFGASGRGTLEHFGIEASSSNCLVVGSLSKALGSIGGFAAGGRDVIDYLRHCSRALLFSTAMAPASAAAALAALEILQSEPELMHRLWSNTRRVHDGLRKLGFDIGKTVAPITPIMLGDEYKVYKMVVALERVGLIVEGVAPPAVKQNQCRIRLCVRAVHSEEEVDRALLLLKRIGRRFGVI